MSELERTVDARTVTDVAVSAEACVALLGALEPICGGTFFYELEAVLKDGEEPGPAANATPPSLSLRFDIATSVMETRQVATPGERAALTLDIVGTDGLEQRVEMPLAALLVGGHDPTRDFCGYTHEVTFVRSGVPADKFSFFGVSGQDWLEPVQSHLLAIRSGRDRELSAAWATFAGQDCIVRFVSTLEEFGLSDEASRAWAAEARSRLESAGTLLNGTGGGQNRQLFGRLLAHS